MATSKSSDEAICKASSPLLAMPTISSCSLSSIISSENRSVSSTRRTRIFAPPPPPLFRLGLAPVCPFEGLARLVQFAFEAGGHLAVPAHGDEVDAAQSAARPQGPHLG